MKSSVSLQKARLLYKYFQDGLIPKLAKHEVHPGLDKGSRENYLYFTLPVALNFQRNSPALWQSALDTFNDPKTNYLFFPDKVASLPADKIQQDLTKHNLALQRHKHTQIWLRISLTLCSKFDCDPRELIKEAGYDAGELIRLLRQDYKKDFPYLSGPKLSNYWPFILSFFTDVKFKNSNQISIIPDTHIIKSSVKLGLVNESAGPLEVEMVWKDLLADSGITPSQMHSVLWHWSRNNFCPAVA